MIDGYTVSRRLASLSFFSGVQNVIGFYLASPTSEIMPPKVSVVLCTIIKSTVFTNFLSRVSQKTRGDKHNDNRGL